MAADARKLRVAEIRRKRQERKKKNQERKRIKLERKQKRKEKQRPKKREKEKITENVKQALLHDKFSEKGTSISNILAYLIFP